MEAKPADLKATAERVLGAKYDAGKLKRLAAVDTALDKRQIQLREQYDSGKLTLDAYISTVNNVLEKAFQKSEEILGAGDFAKVYGKDWRNKAGFLSKEAFGGSAATKRAAAPTATLDRPPPAAMPAAPGRVPQPGAIVPEAPLQSEVPVSLKKSAASYANFARVMGTPEEVIVDFAVNPNPFDNVARTLKLSQRLVMNHFTTKRLLSALAMVVQRHESAFGTIELDVNRRVSIGQETGIARD